MLIVLLDDKGQATSATDSFTQVRAHTKHIGPNFESYAQAEKYVHELNAALEQPGFMITYETRLSEEAGESKPTNVRIAKRPQLGENVASTFKGQDRQSSGCITAISPDLKVITVSTGAKFIRRGRGAQWMWGKRQLAYGGFSLP